MEFRDDPRKCLLNQCCGRKLEEVEYAREGEGVGGGGIARWLVIALADPIGSSKAK